ncbi:hypothetical protein MVEN_01873500 [Mycena venus]|uniref:Uncharacterized protein n=1 Tax=Mycena venus TaxID=2733690 RepID=A0A8H6XH23_9AGAR|nr:hypothetical protein MVEN_01873500 [Mycena venus]
MWSVCLGRGYISPPASRPQTDCTSPSMTRPLRSLWACWARWWSGSRAPLKRRGVVSPASFPPESAPIEGHEKETEGSTNPHIRILIHCAHGISRSPAVGAALLVALPLVDGDVDAAELPGAGEDESDSGVYTDAPVPATEDDAMEGQSTDTDTDTDMSPTTPTTPRSPTTTGWTSPRPPLLLACVVPRCVGCKVDDSREDALAARARYIACVSVIILLLPPPLRLRHRLLYPLRPSPSTPPSLYLHLLQAYLYLPHPPPCSPLPRLLISPPMRPPSAAHSPLPPRSRTSLRAALPRT